MIQRSSRIRMSKILAATLFVFQCFPASTQSPRKKLIATGWDMADAERLKQNLAAMEQRPFDGVVIGLSVPNSAGRLVPVRQTFSVEP